VEEKVTNSALRRSGPDHRGICSIIFDRPDKANAISAELAHQFLDALGAASASGCKAVIIQGAGKNFCAGFDFDGYEALSQRDIVDRFVAIEKSLQLLWRAPFVSISIVQGAAFGAGADIVAASTYRLGSERAGFRFPGFQFGVALGTRRLSQLVGMQNARRILLENHVVGSDEALSIGLLTQRDAEGCLPEIASNLASSIASLENVSIEKILGLTSNADPRSDMDELVQSLTRPGLHERIARYRAANAPKKSAGPAPGPSSK
jgi:enoyl-CoA hydratase/carnithine racemase